MWRKFAWLAASVSVTVGFIVVWKSITDARLVSPVYLPSPARTWAALTSGLQDGELARQWVGTIERMFYGWLLASFVGVAAGAFIGVSQRARQYLQPTLEFMRPLPASAIFPLAISLLGLTDGMILTVIALGALWPMLLATVQGFAAVEPRLYEVSRVLRLSKTAFVFKIALPSSLPDICAGMRLGVTIALILAVVGEMLSSRDGLGSSILYAARGFRADVMFAGVILLGVTGYISSALLSFCETRLIGWRNAH
jgi:sulfonate transport system permease protein